MKTVFTALLILFGFMPTYAQTTMNLDSLLGVSPKNQYDAVELYINIGQQYETNQPDIAKHYYREAGNLSRTLDYPLGFCKYAANYTAVLNMQGKYDSSLVINFDALKVAEQWGDKMWVTKMYFNIGNCYNYKLDYETALSYYLKVVPYFEEIGNKPYQAMIYDVMQVLYQNLKDYPKSINYGEKALALFDDPNSNSRGNALLNLSISYVYGRPTQPEKAMNGYNEVLRIARINQNLYLEGSALQNIADFYYRTNQMEKAKPYYEQSLALCREIDDSHGMCVAIRGLAYYQLYKNNFNEADSLIREVLTLAKDNNFLVEMQEACSSLAELALAKRDYGGYRRFQSQQDSLSSVILNDELIRTTKDLETKYQTEKKQSEIEKLSLIKKQRTLVIYILIGSLLLILLFSYTYFRNISNKKIIADQQLEIKEKELLELKKERELIAAKSVLQGEETERSRIAVDLHHGLGGLLTGVKLKLSTMKENAIITRENLEHFNHALNLLDTSINEMRRVAHNLMPETLVHYGLQTALHDFVKQVSAEGGGPSISFNSFGDDLRFNKEIEITTYRIAQELVTNAIKHAFALQIDIQLFTEKERICLQVNDNGIGFDPEKPDPAKTGKGLENIRDRVTAFNGRFEILSQQGKGTETTLEFFIT
jgi:signal transduction histidine kinase